MPEADFNPHSHNAMFATILGEIKSLREEATEWRRETGETLTSILAEQKKTNGRVTALEFFRKMLRLKVVMISGFAGMAVSSVGWVIINFEALHASMQFFLAAKK